MVEARDGVSVKISGEHANAVFSQLRGGILPNEMDEARLRAPWRSKASSVMDLAALVQDRDFSPNDFVVAVSSKIDARVSVWRQTTELANFNLYCTFLKYTFS